jgi:hypothetical protein
MARHLPEKKVSDVLRSPAASLQLHPIERKLPSYRDFLVQLTLGIPVWAA